jgi:hypothetical protein
MGRFPRFRIFIRAESDGNFEFGWLSLQAFARACSEAYDAVEHRSYVRRSRRLRDIGPCDAEMTITGRANISFRRYLEQPGPPANIKLRFDELPSVTLRRPSEYRWSATG